MYISAPLLAGLHQEVLLEVNAGTEGMPDNARLHVAASDGLIVTAQNLSDGYIELPPLATQERHSIQLDVLARLPHTSQDSIMHKVHV